MARCVDCGFLAERRNRDGAIVQPTEFHREQLAHRERFVDPTLRCYAEFEGFDTAQVRVTIDCPEYIRRLPDRTLWEHLEMRQILDARQEAEEARARQRRDTWIIGGITLAVTTLAVLGAGVLSALISRGIIWGPVG